MARIDYWHTINPAFGARKLSQTIQQQDGLPIGRKLARNLMMQMGIISRAPKPNTSIPNKEHKKFPYLLRGKHIWLPNQVWAIDITYVIMGKSHMYLTAVIDWYSRYIVGWTLSYTLDTAPVLQVVEDAVKKYGTPSIINSDQGSQFTSREFTELIANHSIRQSMDGKARWVDNVIIERWFRSLKCEEIYINGYTSPKELKKGISDYINLYNTIRPHESLDNLPPVATYTGHFLQTA
jgi:putative transposase